jgi:hypothetical protein
MKIVLVHNFYRQTGGEDVVFESEKHLLEQAGHRVIPYVRSNTELADDSVLHRIGIAGAMIWSHESRRRFASLLDAERPDLVHVHNTFMVISPSIYSACSERGIPVVKTLHNFRWLCPGASFFRNGGVCEECLDFILLSCVVMGLFLLCSEVSSSVVFLMSRILAVC